MVDAVRTIGVTEATYYRWRQEFGGLRGDQPEPPLSTHSGGRVTAAASAAVDPVRLIDTRERGR